MVKQEFDRAMLEIYRIAADRGYRAGRFRQLIAMKGGWQAAKHLLSSGPYGAQPGLDRLWEMDMLDHSMEALALQPRFESLFSDWERLVARERLEARGWRPPTE